MGREILTNTLIHTYESKEKSYKVYDGGGLYVLIHPNGSKYFRLKYYFQGKEKLLSIGVFPVVTLEMAREKMLESKRNLFYGKDPCALKKSNKKTNLTASPKFQTLIH